MLLPSPMQSSGHGPHGPPGEGHGELCGGLRDCDGSAPMNRSNKCITTSSTKTSSKAPYY